MKLLPIGIQTFEEIRTKDLLYVDKTKYVLDLVQNGKYYFFARPRRFGKSLLLSTLKAFFEGKSELFEGLYLGDNFTDWREHPVIHLDYSRVEYQQGTAIFQRSLHFQFQSIAKEYNITLDEGEVANVFNELVQKLKDKYNQQVVILIDEYDKPLVDTLLELEKFTANQTMLRNLYGNIKALDANLKFVMLTGVSRFSKVGIFSGLNNLEDISVDDRYHSIVGFSQQEVEAYFLEYLTALVEKTGLSLTELKEHIKFWYNGFSWDGEHRLYNPFSLFNLFHKKVFANYWFSTGTPTFLINLVKTQKKIPENFEQIRTYDLVGSSENFKQFPLVPLLFQTGYLTISKVVYDGVRPIYQLDYPNDEVRHSFLTYIAADFINKDQYKIEPEVIKLREALIQERIPDFLNYLRSFFADIPSRLHLPKEAYYHSMVYMLLRLSGVQLLLEKETDKGKIDGVLELADKIYIIEFKFARSKRIKRVATLADKAIRQIEEKKYYEPYMVTSKKIILLGIGFLDKAIAGKVKYLN